jgi:hypothetical protein
MTVVQTTPECRDSFPEARDYKDPEFWLDECIWGHRIYDQASPDMIVLEMLNVASCLRRQGKAPFRDPTPSDKVTIPPFRRSLVLRTILFNNPRVNTNRNMADAWERQEADLYSIWSSYAAKGGKVGYPLDGPEGFSFLRDGFKTYEAYTSFVDILRKGALEYDSNKRWTSKFLFPYAEEALFEDLSDRDFSSDRRFFGRSGELAYLMLCRSGRGVEIWEGFRTVLFDRAIHANRWKKGIRALMHPYEVEAPAGADGGRRLGYLPYPEHRVFRTFGEDVALLLQAGMPEYDVLPHVGRITAFHLAHYLLSVSTEGLGDSPHPAVKYTVEVNAPRADTARRLARFSYQVNNELPARRLDAALAAIGKLDGVAQARETEDKAELKRKLTARWWPQLTTYRAAANAADLWNEFQDRARKRHKQHLGKVHHEYMRACGLASREGANAYRYCPSDAFLRTLVLANVSSRMDFEIFLNTLYDRYGIAVARRHVAQYGHGDLTDFDLNAERLQARLVRLGLVHRLSDACAYVVNRYGEGNSQ